MAEPRLAEGAAIRRQSLASAALATFGTSVAVAVVSLLNVLIVARALGPVGRGNVAFLTTIAYLTSQLALLGIEQANVNLASSEPKARAALATNSLIFSVVFGALAIAVLAGLIAVVPAVGGETSAGLRWLTLASIPMLIFQTYLLLLVRADYAFHIANAAYFVVPVANVTVNGLLWALGLLSVTTAVATWIGGQALGTLLMAAYLRVRLAGFGRPDTTLGRRALRFGLKAHGGRIMMLGNYKADQWLVGAMAGPRELGLYSVAVAWAESLFYLPTAIASVQRPDLVRASTTDASRETTRTFRATVLITVPLAAGLVAAAPFLCVVVFGSAFRGSIDDLRILTAGAFGIVALKLLGNTLTAQRKPVLETAAIAAAFVVTIVLDIILIPAHGGLGAAIASSAAYTAGGVTVALIFTRACGGRLAELVPAAKDVAALGRSMRRRLARATPEDQPFAAERPAAADVEAAPGHPPLKAP
jgi:O-antigen/teichoic acid export membrane protein